MSDPYRRSQPGGEPPLAFDDRRPRRRGPAPVTLIVSVLLLAAVAGGVFYLYRGGARGANDAPQPVGAPISDVRTPAPPQPRAADPAAGLSIYKNDPNAAAAPAFAPPPEQPTPRPASRPLATALSTQALAPPVASAPPKASPAEPVAKPATKAKPASEKTASIDSLIADSATAPPAAVKSGAAVVQIGAFTSESLADKGWSDAAAVAPGAMAGKSKRVVPLSKDGGTLYRTSIAGFASRDEAQAMCDKLKAAGQTCFVR